jgi:hypothetical protein
MERRKKDMAKENQRESPRKGTKGAKLPSSRVGRVNTKKILGASGARESVLYARISESNKEFIESLSSQYGISISRVVNDVFDRIREQNAG